MASVNKYMAFHYIKFQKLFPTINIVYAIKGKYLDFCLTSFVSILKNSEFENINLILIYNGLNQNNIQEINKLKEIRFFTLLTLEVSESLFTNFSSKSHSKNEQRLNLNLLLNFLCEILNDDKILYLSHNTIVRKSLLSLWEINLNNYLIAGVEDISDKNNQSLIKLNDIFYINDGVFLLNIKEWRKIKKNGIMNYIKNINKIYQSNKDLINFFADTKILKLKDEFYNKEIFNKYLSQYDKYIFILRKKKTSTTIHFEKKEIKANNYNSSFINEFFEYYHILNNVKSTQITIPIILFANNDSAPFMYTTMISILENGNRNTYYSFYIFVYSNFSISFENHIFEINKKYKCYIYLKHLPKMFEDFISRTSNLQNNYHFLMEHLIPKELDKCIYLDADICVNKDLSELFNIDMKDNFIAGVLDAKYFFSEVKNYKKLNLSLQKQYINTGMLLINLKQIRKNNMTQKLSELSKGHYNTQNQDLLNSACYNKIIILPPKYNAMVSILKENHPLLRELYKEEDIIEAKDSPYIINYSSKKKPWNSLGVYMEKYWWDIAKKTPFINSLFSRKNIYINKLKKFWYNRKKKFLDINNPKTFNEKIQWLKLYDSTPIKTRLTDKYLVREWISEKIGKEYLIPLLGVYDKFEDINFKKLPNKFVIKCNHGSGYNIIVRNKTHLNLTKVKSKIEKWMNENFAFKVGLELHYRDIQRKIVIEQYMDDGTGDLRDYKISCFNGKPEFIWIDSDRHSNHKRNIYDLNWNQLPYKINIKYSTFPSPKKPKSLKKILELASILSRDFVYVRVDFYIINNKIYFGEMTFTSTSGLDEITPKNFERRLASLIIFPKVVYNIDTGEYYKLEK